MSASIDSISVYPNVVYLQAYDLLKSCTATLGTSYTASSVSCSGSKNQVSCSAMFDFGSGYTPNNDRLTIKCGDNTVFDLTISCTSQIIGPATIVVTEQTSS